MIYLLLQCWDYEGSDVIAAFGTREQAEAEAARLSDGESLHGPHDPSYRVQEIALTGGSQTPQDR
jgi:hypothetical protein